MRYIVSTPSGLNLLHDTFYFCGHGMWSSEREDAVEFPSRSDANEATKGSSFSPTLTIEEVPDETVN